nr:lysine-rich arabinogalactan protein 19-like [Lolium perenne]
MSPRRRRLQTPLLEHCHLQPPPYFSTAPLRPPSSCIPPPASSCPTHVAHRSTPPPPAAPILKPPLPFVPRSMSPPSTCPVSDQDVCLQPDSLSTRSRPRRTTPVGAPVAAALGPGSSNQHWERRVFFHVPPKPELQPCTSLESFQVTHEVEQQRLMEERDRVTREEAKRRIVKAQPHNRY